MKNSGVESSAESGHRIKIVAATGNAGKAGEIREILRDIGLDADVATMKEAGLFAKIEENGTTFLENAVIKAKAVAQLAARSGEWKDALVIADDSGLVIDALGGEPGIYSARYLGRSVPYAEKNQELLRRLANVAEEKRSARFVCAVAAACPDGELLTAQGVMEGKIGREQKGEHGFGYDPIFYLPERGCTAAQLSAEEKNSLSHRGKALRALQEKLKEKYI